MQCFPDRTAGRRAMWTGAAAWAVVALSGCPWHDNAPKDQSIPQAKPTPMRVVVVEDGPFAEVIERQWKARIDNELQLTQMSIAQIEAAKQLAMDIIFYPSACLGTLVEHKLVAEPSAEVLAGPEYAARDVLELQRTVENRWGEKIYAFSFGSPSLVLMYRADLFEQLKLEPPETWTQYAALLPQLAHDPSSAAAPGEDQPWSAAIEPLGEGWGAKILLARAAAYVSHPSQFSALFDYATMEPLLTRPPFLRALEELVAAARTSTVDLTHYTPESARRALMAGRTAMALTWPSRTTHDGKPLPLAEGVRIDFAKPPGSDTVYNFSEQLWTPRGEAGKSMHVPLLGTAGVLASVGTNARRPKEAARILALMSGPEWSPRLCPLCRTTTMFRQSHAKNPDLWTDEMLPRESSDRYAEILRASQSEVASLIAPRLPGWQRYLAALDQAVQDACTGAQTPTAALEHAVEAWNAITHELGLDAQQKAYTRSLGLEP